MAQRQGVTAKSHNRAICGGVARDRLHNAAYYVSVVTMYAKELKECWALRSLYGLK